jgi:hypothetical protein
MKKVIALLMVLAVFTTTAFAAPVSVDGSPDDSSADYSRLILKNSYWSLHTYK